MHVQTCSFHTSLCCLVTNMVTHKCIWGRNNGNLIRGRLGTKDGDRFIDFTTLLAIVPLLLSASIGGSGKSDISSLSACNLG